MAIDTFIPEIWAGGLLSNLHNVLVFGQAGVTNSNYEGEVSRAGDTVHVNSVGAVSVRSYTKNSTSVSYDTINATEQTITVAQAEYFGLKVDDIDRRQALPGFVEEATREAAYALATQIDSYVAGVMRDGATDLGAGTAAVSDPTGAYDLLVDLRTAHQRANTPTVGRWVIVTPEFYAYLLRDDRFISAEKAGTTDGLRNGFVGRAAGFDVIESNTVPVVNPEAGENQDLTPVLLSGTAASTTFISQIASVEALRLESSFSDAIRGLQLYDAAVLEGRETNLVKVAVTLS